MPAKPKRLSLEQVDSLQETVLQMQAWWTAFRETAFVAVRRLRQHGDFSRCHDEIRLNEEPLLRVADVFHERLHAALLLCDGATRVALLDLKDKMLGGGIPPVFYREYEKCWPRRSPQFFVDALPALNEQASRMQKSWFQMRRMLRLAVEAGATGQLGGGADGGDKPSIELWSPSPGYVGTKRIMRDERFRKNGKNPPRTTLQQWQKSNPPVERAPDSGELFYPESWVLDCIRTWHPRT